MNETQVTSVEIARLAGVGRAAVTNWRRRYDDFPRPVGGTATSPQFSLDEVETWLRRHAKISHLPAEEHAWQHIRALSPDHELPDAVRRAGALLLSGEADTVDEPHRPLRRALADLAATHGRTGAYELLLGRLHDAVRLPRVSRDAADLLIALLDPDPAAIYDPACGTGTLLTAAHARFPEAHLYGDETDSALLGLAQLRLTAHEAQSVDLRAGGLRHPPDPPLAADAALCAPPPTERDRATGNIAYDPRWQFGVPPRAESELAWVQHALANLRPGGFAVLLLPPAAAARPSGRRIRAELLRRGALRAVIALPSGAAPPQNLGMHVWLLRRPPGDEHPERLLFADLTTDDVASDAWTAHADMMRTALNDAARGKDPPAPPTGALRAVRVMDLLDDEVDVSPARRLHTECAPTDPAEVIRVRERLRDHLVRAHTMLPALETTSRMERLPMITIGELARTGAVAVTARNPVREHAEPGGDGDTVPMWLARDVVAGHGPGAGVPADRVPDNAIRIRAGDIVAPAIGPALNAVVATGNEIGAVLGPNLYLLRPDPDVLDPWFLAGFLRRDSNKHRAGSLGSVNRYDIRRAQVPRIPLADQRRYGELFDQLHQFVSAIRMVSADTNDLLRRVTDGLVAGTVHPPPYSVSS